MWEEELRIYDIPEVPNNFPSNGQAISSYFFIKEYFFPFISKKFLTCHTMEKNFFPNYNKDWYFHPQKKKKKKPKVATYEKTFFMDKKNYREKKKASSIPNLCYRKLYVKYWNNIFCWKYLYFLLKTWFVLDGSVPAIHFFLTDFKCSSLIKYYLHQTKINCQKYSN